MNNPVDPRSSFIAYASQPIEIGQVIEAAIEIARTRYGLSSLVGWKENDIAGRFLNEPILDNISAGERLVADVTALNFNVTFEIGYAIGRRKRLLLIRNTSLIADESLISDVGIYDTIGYQSYETSDALADFLAATHEKHLLRAAGAEDRRSPIYLVLPPKLTDLETRIVSRIKKTRLGFRVFDPTESARLSGGEAIDGVAAAVGVVTPLLSPNRVDARVHNQRAAFVAGLAVGMGKELLLLQAGNHPVPLDYRDLVKNFDNLDDINECVADFAPEVTARLYQDDDEIEERSTSFLASMTLGSSVAENELRQLKHYYIEKDEFRRAENGDAQIMVGRKGSGKTALFARLRDRLRRNQSRIVLDLQPQGYQLVKMKEEVLASLQQGTREHAVAAFWEYVLLLEIAYKILEKDREPHLRNHELFEPYRALESVYGEKKYAGEGDFAERMQFLIDGVTERFAATTSGGECVALNHEQLTEILYSHDVRQLRSHVIEYLKRKDGLWILFDNLDKGWPAQGIGDEDVLLISSLIDALTNLRRTLSRSDIECNGILFLRNDVHEMVMDGTSDRGKVIHVPIDWTDADELREMLRRRFEFCSDGWQGSFEEAWQRLCVSHIDGEESSQYLIDRCLMRPRCLLDFFAACRSHAVNLGRDQIEIDDVRRGEERYSGDMLHNVGYELRDVCPEGEDVLYAFVEAPRQIFQSELERRVSQSVEDPEKQREITRLLLWYGVLGLVRENDIPTYIYNTGYDMKRLQALIDQTHEERRRYEINPAFWSALEAIPA